MTSKIKRYSCCPAPGSDHFLRESEGGKWVLYEDVAAYIKESLDFHYSQKVISQPDGSYKRLEAPLAPASIRLRGANCVLCVYYKPVKIPSKGLCVSNPPSVGIDATQGIGSHSSIEGLWPLVDACAWCGRFERKDET